MSVPEGPYKGPRNERSEIMVRPVSVMKPCPVCTTRWVDQSCSKAGIRLADAARRQLIAGLLARRHLILSGPRGAGKYRLAKALSRAVALDRSDHVCSLQGHPWWAAKTGDVSRYVELQTDFSHWRLINFVEPLLSARESLSSLHTEAQEGVYVACVERMSPVEIDLYFVQFARWLLRQEQEWALPAPLRLIGTFDSNRPPVLDATVQRYVAVVHLDSAALMPEGETVAVEFTPEETGEIPFQCQMGMLRDKLIVQNWPTEDE